MPFCTNCGRKLSDDMNFCGACGFPVAKRTDSLRRQEWKGKVITCPSCGEEVQSFTAKCPACGHEFNSSHVSSALKDFVTEINECDKLIADTPDMSNTGWKSWGGGKRFWWIVLNIFTSCIPLVIYLVIPLIKLKSTPRLTPDEKRKAALIENFPFPNEREAILEALLFAKSKISYLSSESVNRKNAYWTRLWSSKGEQLYQRAEMMFNGDEIAIDAYKEIVAQKKRVSRSVRIKALFGVGILIVAILFLLYKKGIFEELDYSFTPLEIPETELSQLMPRIENGRGRISVDNSEYFSVDYYSISVSEFEEYKTRCKESGFTIDCENTGSVFDAYNKDGYNIRIVFSTSEMDVTVTDALDMRTIVWPKSKIAKLLPRPESDYGIIKSSSETCLIAYIGNMTFDEYKTYIYKCVENGFDQDMYQYDKSYHAKNFDGYKTKVDYIGNNTVFIRIDD